MTAHLLRLLLRHATSLSDVQSCAAHQYRAVAGEPVPSDAAATQHDAAKQAPDTAKSDDIFRLR